MEEKKIMEEKVNKEPIINEGMTIKKERIYGQLKHRKSA